MKKKILFINDDLGRGGAAKIATDLANFLSLDGHDISFAVLSTLNQVHELHPTIHLLDLSIRPEIAFGKLWKNKKLNSLEKAQIDKEINQQSFDLILLGYHNGYYLYPNLKQKDKTYLWIHGELLEFRPTKNPIKLLKELVRQIKNKYKFKKLFSDKKCITVNPDLAKRYKSIEPSSEFISIANGVPSYTPSCNPLNKKWDTIFVGRLVTLKQVDHAIHAFAKSGLTGKMAIIGDGPEKENLKNLVKELNYNHRIDFLGWKDNPREYMAQSRSLIMCSYYEGYGLVLAEAVSQNIPVVSYNSSSGVENIFTEQFKSICLVEKQNISLLAQRLSNIVQNPPDYDQESLELVSMQRMAREFLKLIQ